MHYRFPAAALSAAGSKLPPSDELTFIPHIGASGRKRPNLTLDSTASTEINSPPAGGRFNLFLNLGQLGIAIYSAEFTVAQRSLRATLAFSSLGQP
jgi:hypothetical protein